MSKLRGALLFSSLAQQSNLLISLFSMTIIARLLTPSEVGVFAVASSVAVLGIELRSFGVSQYLVREAELDDEKKSTALGMMMLISWSLAVLVIVGAPAFARFYNQPDLRYLLWILSITFVLAPFSTVPFGMLVREMRFKHVMRIKLATGVTRAAGSIGFVLLGWSYFGLAAGLLLASIVEFLAISWIDRSRSLLRPSFARWSEVLSFGLITSGTGMLQRLSQSAPDLVLGRVATMGDVGIFSRGLGLMMFLDQLIGLAVKPVILPHLSEIRRRGGNVGEEYLKCIALHGAVSLPVFATSGVLALPLIRLFFGDQWDAAAPIASILVVWAMLRTVHSFLTNALLAIGQERLLLWKQIGISIARFALIIGAADQGLIAVAWAVCISGAVDLVLSTVIVSRVLGSGPFQVFRTFVPNLGLSALCWTTAMLASTLPTRYDLGSLIEILFVGTLTSIVWLGALRFSKHDLWGHGIDMTRDIFTAIRRLVGIRDH